MYITDSEVQQMLFGMYAIVAGNSILMYDHMVTLPEEIAFIWRRPKALSAMLFLLNRYGALLINISTLVVYFRPVISDELSCLKYSLYRELALFLQGIIVCIIMAMRTYALYGLCCAGTFGKYSGDVDIVPGIGCIETFSKAVYVILIPVSSQFIFDLFIFILTMYRIYKTWGLLRLSLVTRRNIIDVMFNDAMTLSNIPNILSYYSSSVRIQISHPTFSSSVS
ncbi:hypothetical protein BDR07DRAFT_1418463 [Suillus spraguei]|nr:hypothetical protein BDR07DRAFT_1418463 [Suillus spraguei]